MTRESSPAVVVLLVGPQASGKSTVARALVERLRAENERVALVELDRIAEMALPTLPSWDTAAHIFALVAGEWARAELTYVVAEGIASRAEITTFLTHIPAEVVTVAMTTPFDAALPRALADPTRAMSRDPSWLSARYDEWAVELSRMEADLLLDMGTLAVDHAVDLITAALESVRSARRNPGTIPHGP